MNINHELYISDIIYFVRLFYIACYVSKIIIIIILTADLTKVYYWEVQVEYSVFSWADLTWVFFRGPI